MDMRRFTIWGIAFSLSTGNILRLLCCCCITHDDADGIGVRVCVLYVLPRAGLPIVSLYA